MSVASRQHPPSSSSSHRTPRKSSSFLSLRREKDKPIPVPEIYPSSSEAPGSSHRTQTTYFDAYPRPKSSPNTRSVKGKVRRTSTADGFFHPPIPKQSPVATTYAFPSFDTAEESNTLPSVPYTRLAPGQVRQERQDGKRQYLFLNYGSPDLRQLSTQKPRLALLSIICTQRNLSSISRC